MNPADFPLNGKAVKHQTPFLSPLVPLFQKRVFAQNLCYENDFDLHETRFHVNGFARGLVLTRRQKTTWK